MLFRSEIHGSRIPVVSAVGHEVDFTIADFVADLRAPTPSAAAELIVREQEAMLSAIAEIQLRLARVARDELARARLLLRSLVAALKSPRDRIQELQLRFDDWSERLAHAALRHVEKGSELVKRLEAELGALSPLKVLDRGYSIAFDESGRAVRSSRQLPAGARFALRLQDGTVSAESRGAKG